MLVLQASPFEVKLFHFNSLIPNLHWLFYLWRFFSVMGV
jgi:hypothetical protein